PGGPIRLVPVRAPPHQGRSRGRGRGRARARGRTPQRPCGRLDVRRQGGVRRATREGTAARVARHPRPCRVHPAGPRHEPRRGAAPRLPRARPPPQAMIRRHTTPPRHLAGGVRRAVWFAILGVVAGWRLAAGQGGAGWVAAPDRPTVGDTVWLERTVTAAPGWRVRAGKLEAGERVEPLGDPVVRRASSPDGWVVRYPVAAW